MFSSSGSQSLAADRERASEQASKQARRPASQKASKPEGQQASKPASQPASHFGRQILGPKLPFGALKAALGKAKFELSERWFSLFFFFFSPPKY